MPLEVHRWDVRRCPRRGRKARARRTCTPAERIVPSRSPRPRTNPSSRPGRPRGETRGMDHPKRRSSGATAREVTTSNVRLPWSSSARPLTTSTLSRPSSATTSSRKVVRRSSGSTRVTAQVRTLRSPAPAPGAPHRSRGHDDGGALRDELAGARPSSAGAGPTAAVPPADRCSPRTTPSVGQQLGVALGQGHALQREHPPRLGRQEGVVPRETSSLTTEGSPRGAWARRPRTPTSGRQPRPASWTTLRSKARHRLERQRLPGLLDLSDRDLRQRRPGACAAPRGARRCRASDGERSPVSRYTASRVSSCRASSTSPLRPDELARGRSPTIARLTPGHPPRPCRGPRRGRRCRAAPRGSRQRCRPRARAAGPSRAEPSAASSDWAPVSWSTSTAVSCSASVEATPSVSVICSVTCVSCLSGQVRCSPAEAPWVVRQRFFLLVRCALVWRCGCARGLRLLGALGVGLRGEALLLELRRGLLPLVGRLLAVALLLGRSGGGRRERGCCGSRRTAGTSSRGSTRSSRRARRSGTRHHRPRRRPAGRRGAASAAGRRGPRARRRACSCSSADAG